MMEDNRYIGDYSRKTSAVFYIYCIVTFIFIAGIYVFSPPMFFDGLIYSSISVNMSEGYGSFWQPYFASEAFPLFSEHPPLMMIVQSLFHRLLGDYIYISTICFLFRFRRSIWF